MELVRTGLDLLEFPSIIFMQTVNDVEVVFLSYAQSAQSRCLALMAEKIAVSQSTPGDIPESGLDSLNQRGDSIEMAMARDLIAT